MEDRSSRPGDHGRYPAWQRMEMQQLTNVTANLLRNVADGVFDNPVDSERLTAFLSCPRHYMLLAVVIGMASAVEYFHPDKPPQMWINELSVTPKRQNQ